jgi:hypothetical protein
MIPLFFPLVYPNHEHYTRYLCEVLSVNRVEGGEKFGK